MKLEIGNNKKDWPDATGYIVLTFLKFDRVAIHIGIRKKDRLWGYEKDWYDGPWHSFGLGPFGLICW